MSAASRRTSAMQGSFDGVREDEQARIREMRCLVQRLLPNRSRKDKRYAGIRIWQVVEGTGPHHIDFTS